MPAKIAVPAVLPNRAPASDPAPARPAHSTPVASIPPARLKLRHHLILLSLVVGVLLPTLGAGLYLMLVADDQYASTVAFSVRREETPSTELLGGLSRIAGGSSTSDTDILYDFLLSQEMVQLVDERVDLRTTYSKAWPGDPVFAFNPAGTIEDLHDKWLSMVRVDYDGASGLITLESRAFTATDAQQVAKAAFEKSSQMINGLSDTARADATRYTQADLDLAQSRLREAREALTRFRLRTQIIDIGSDIQSQMGILTQLQAQLANVLVETDMLRETTRADDPRLIQAQQRIRVIEDRIAAERAKFGVGGRGPAGEDYATLASTYEGLIVEQEFAEQSYRSALAAHDIAKTAAQRQSRYLAPHIRPTLAEQAIYPQRIIYTSVIFFFLLAIWSIAILVHYSIRDRR